MATAQTAIFSDQSKHFYFLEYTLNEAHTAEQLGHALASVYAPKNSVFQLIAFGPKLADRMFPQATPEQLHEMKALKGPVYSMPSHQGDLLFWLHGNDVSDIYDQVLCIQESLKEIAEVQLDQAGFTYHDNKDLIGFEDGTANPKEDARHPVALINEGPYQGGSIVFSQKWQHDLQSFLSLPLEQQEKIVGRTKVENEELTGDAMPKDSHVSRTDVKVDGEAMKIYRRSAPYGNAKEKGLMFLCFACDQKRIQVQLERMTGTTEDKLSDHLMKYSTPVSGSYWYAPPVEELERLIK
ncbi:Dyp-type peroxidase [Litoribacillus peritrichatus]|uniref:Dyp-type peroxidase n=1 Tax=Litoribacillus peritrichatus TaxID=718191 RepID=A0ABP7M0A6_9GAMM